MLHSLKLSNQYNGEPGIREMVNQDVSSLSNQGDVGPGC